MKKYLIVILTTIAILLVLFSSFYYYLLGPVAKYIGKTDPKLGVIVMPTADIPGTNFSAWPGSLATKIWTIVKIGHSLNYAYRIAHENRFSVAHFFVDWGDIEVKEGEYDWLGVDAFVKGMERNNLEVSLIIKVIDTYKLGNYPSDIDFRGFDDPEFIERLKIFVTELVNRYNVSYLWIGNEVTDYFIQNPEQFEQFLTMYDEIEKEIKSIDPQIIVGPDAEYFPEGADIIKKLAEKGDAIAISTYPNTDQVQPSITEVEAYFDNLMNATSPQKVALVETSWATKEPFGNESTQEQYVRELFKIMRKYENRWIFFSWSFLYDLSETSVNTLSEDVYSEIVEEHPVIFLDWIGSIGLIHNNGTGKKAWHVWKEEAEKLVVE